MRKNARAEGSIGQFIQTQRQARGLTQDALARLAEVPYTTLTKVESGVIKSPSAQFVAKISQALGISSDSLLAPKMYQGADSIRSIWADVLASLTRPGETMYMSGVKEADFLKANQTGLIEFINELKTRGLQQKLLVAESDRTFLAGEHLEYRAIPDKYFSATPIYVYANKIAMLIWGPPQQAVIFENSLLAETFLKQFLFLWDQAKPVIRN
jgi:transcriptional regulator with XRE-family HTH domain